MITRSLSLLALAAFASAVAAAPAMACCGCAYTCAPPAQVQTEQVQTWGSQTWGLSPSYVVNQGPVYTGPGFYSSPTYEGETLTVDYPYVGPYGYPGYYRPYDGGPSSEPFRHRLYHPYWQGALPRHFEMLHRHEAGVIYRRGFGPRAITMSKAVHWDSRGHGDLRD